MRTREYYMTQALAHIVCGIVALLAVLPFILLIIASFTEESVAIANGYSYFPEKWSLEAYIYMKSHIKTIGTSYLMSIAVTATGVIGSLILTTLYAYAISQDGIPGMGVIRFLLFFTMMFGGGLVSYYYVIVKFYHLLNTFWVQVFPGLMGAFNVILMRNYIRTSIPENLVEAARLDGAGEFCIFSKVVMPLSLPITATIGIFVGLGYWNNWTNGLYFLRGKEGAKYYTLQNILQNMNLNIEQLRSAGEALIGMEVSFPSTTIRMSLAVIGVVPVLVLYPFFQKYFVKGITLGGIKE